MKTKLFVLLLIFSRAWALKAQEPAAAIEVTPDGLTIKRSQKTEKREDSAYYMVTATEIQYPDGSTREETISQRVGDEAALVDAVKKKQATEEAYQAEAKAKLRHSRIEVAVSGRELEHIKATGAPFTDLEREKTEKEESEKIDKPDKLSDTTTVETTKKEASTPEPQTPKKKKRRRL